MAAFREEVLARLDRIEARLDERAPLPDDSRSPARPLHPDPRGPGIPDARPDSPLGEPPAAGLAGIPDSLPDGEIRVIVSPLRDLSLARAVESSLARSEGVEQATLRELRGDSATIDVRAGDGFSVLGSLRRHLPVAFDVTGSDERSVTIALAQPQAGSEGGVAANGNR